MAGLSLPEPDFEVWHKNGRADLWWAGLMALSTTVTSVVVWFTWVTNGPFELKALATIVEVGVYFFFLFYQGAREQYYFARSEDLRDLNEAQLKRLGFEKTSPILGITIFVRAETSKKSESPGKSELVLKMDGKAVAIVDVYKVHDGAFWKLGSADRLQEGNNVLSLASVFGSQMVRDAIGAAQSGRTEFIAVGLASHTGDVPREGMDYQFTLDRAKRLGEALIVHGRADRSLNRFRAANLGVCNIPADPDSEVGRRQRAAVVIAVHRRLADEDKLKLEDAFGIALKRADLANLDLMDFRHSWAAPKELRESEVDFAGFV